MWTDADRNPYRQAGDRLPSDLTDPEWERLEPLIPQAKPGGRSRKTDMRSAMNAILYLLRTGCPWRYLPRGVFPPRSTAIAAPAARPSIVSPPRATRPRQSHPEA